MKLFIKNKNLIYGKIIIKRDALISLISFRGWADPILLFIIFSIYSMRVVLNLIN